MKLRGLLLAALYSAGMPVAPALAQLVHISVNNPEGHLLFKTDDASISWNTSAGFITQLDFTFDSQARAGALNPARNFGHMRVENPALGRVFNITLPFQWASVSDQSLLLQCYISKPGVFIDSEFSLVFDSPVADDGTLPDFPLPGLGVTEYSRSTFDFWSGNAPFHVRHLAEAYGIMDIESVTVTLVPIPEPSTYALAGLALLGAVIALRRRLSPAALSLP
jgi:hypothetical protein